MDTQAFFPANRQLPGDRDGGHDGDRGPLWSAPSSPLASPWWWARAMPPLWQYFARLRRRPDHQTTSERTTGLVVASRSVGVQRPGAEHTPSFLTRDSLNAGAVSLMLSRVPPRACSPGGDILRRPPRRDLESCARYWRKTPWAPSRRVRGIMPGELTADQAIGFAETLSRGQPTASRSCARD